MNINNKNKQKGVGMDDVSVIVYDKSGSIQSQKKGKSDAEAEFTESGDFLKKAISSVSFLKEEVHYCSNPERFTEALKSTSDDKKLIIVHRADYTQVVAELSRELDLMLDKVLLISDAENGANIFQIINDIEYALPSRVSKMDEQKWKDAINDILCASEPTKVLKHSSIQPKKLDDIISNQFDLIKSERGKLALFKVLIPEHLKYKLLRMMGN